MSAPYISSSAIRQLEIRLEGFSNDEQRLSALTELAEYYTFTNIKEARRLLERQLAILGRHPRAELLLQYHLNTAIVENQFYNYTLSEIHFKDSLILAEEYADINRQAEIFIDYSGTLVNLGENEKASLYLERAKRHLIAYPDAILSARLRCREGYIALQYSDFDRAIEFFFEAEKMYDSIQGVNLPIKDQFFRTLIQSGLGTIYEKTNDLVRSVSAYIKTLEMCEALGIRSRLSWHYLNVGKAYMALSDYEHAEVYLRKLYLLT